jgi:rhodanese-related sulfurtransferase
VHQLLARLEEVPAGKLWVHCGSGYRAAVAASLLQRAGRDVVHVDARFGDAEAAGVELARLQRDGVQLANAKTGERAAPFSGRV